MATLRLWIGLDSKLQNFCFKFVNFIKLKLALTGSDHHFLAIKADSFRDTWHHGMAYH